MSALERNLARCILNAGPFTADDVTSDGVLSLDPAHTPNSRQSGIGSLFNQASRRGLISATGGLARSRAPHRKGGAIRVWIGTEAGRLWAKNLLS
jgi:hypothetical protein